MRAKKPKAFNVGGVKTDDCPKTWPFGVDPRKAWKDGIKPTIKTAAKKRTNR